MSHEARESIAELVETARDPAVPLSRQDAAFARLVERSQHIVLGRALASLGNYAEAEEAAQDAFTTAWQRLRQLRDPAAFTAWLRKIVATQCRRRLRRRSAAAGVELPAIVEPGGPDGEYRSLVASCLAALPAGERSVVVLFYFLGYTLLEIARLLELKPGTVGKRLHSARRRIRRRLPPSVRGELVRLAPSRAFVEKIRRGLFDEYVGEYRFAERPDLDVRIVREGDSLVSIAGGQRNVLASLDDRSLVTRHYDGEGRFGRNRRGEVTHFVYWEFGQRLGTARKTRGDEADQVNAAS